MSRIRCYRCGMGCPVLRRHALCYIGPAVDSGHQHLPWREQRSRRRAMPRARQCHSSGLIPLYEIVL
eukprot:2166953-Rhodomonas_salina.5